MSRFNSRTLFSSPMRAAPVKIAAAAVIAADRQGEAGIDAAPDWKNQKIIHPSLDKSDEIDHNISQTNMKSFTGSIDPFF